MPGSNGDDESGGGDRANDAEGNDDACCDKGSGGDDDTGAGYGNNAGDENEADAENVGVVVGEDPCDERVYDLCSCP